MKKTVSIVSALALCALAFTAAAQDIVVPPGYELVDSLVYTPLSAEDENLVGVTIYGAMPEGVSVRQSTAVRNALDAQIRANESKTVNGYRVRIFFDNKQDSRNASDAAARRFTAKYHGMQAYRSYDNPYFKVTVGDFRTKAEAQAALQRIKADFPSSFVVREKIRYPALSPDAYQVDTVRILKPTAAR